MFLNSDPNQLAAKPKPADTDDDAGSWISRELYFVNIFSICTDVWNKKRKFTNQ